MTAENSSNSAPHSQTDLQADLQPDSQSGPQADSHSLLQKALREPTVHFLLIALLIFAAYGVMQAENDNLLEINQRDVDARIFMQEMASGEELSPEQKELVTAFYIEEQILVREALAMGLDNDERIHDILAQKMRHVLSGSVIQPTPDELRDYYEANSSRFETAETIDLDELVFNSREPLDESMLTLLRQGAEPDALLSMSEGNVAPLLNVNSVDLANIFDQELAESVRVSELGIWQGPFDSNRGQHWLRATSRTPARVPALEEIVDLVRLEWIASEEESLLQAEVDKLWEQYTIVITDEEAE